MLITRRIARPRSSQAPASDAVEDGGRKKVVQHTLARVIQTERVNEGDSVKCYSIDTLFPQSLE